MATYVRGAGPTIAAAKRVADLTARIVGAAAVFGATGCGDVVATRLPAGTGSEENRVGVGEVWTCLTIPIISMICTVVRG
jgi:hypothetical protein